MKTLFGRSAFTISMAFSHEKQTFIQLTNNIILTKMVFPGLIAFGCECTRAHIETRVC